MDDGTREPWIKSTRTSFRIIEAIRRDGHSGVTALADQLDTSKSTVYAHLNTLTRDGYVVKRGEKYRLGMRFLTLGGHVRRTNGYKNLYESAKPEIDDLIETTGERAQIMVEEQGRGFYLYQASGARAVTVGDHVGRQIPLHATAAGKAYLAHVPTNHAESLLAASELSEFRETGTEIEELREELRSIRKRGVAFDRGEHVSGVHCVAAPIKTEDGDVFEDGGVSEDGDVSEDGGVFGALSVSVPKKRASGPAFERELPETVVDVARVIALNATYA